MINDLLTAYALFLMAPLMGFGMGSKQYFVAIIAAVLGLVAVALTLPSSPEGMISAASLIAFWIITTSVIGQFVIGLEIGNRFREWNEDRTTPAQR